MLITGTLTFMFTDIEDSSRLWDSHPEAMRLALAAHNEVVKRAAADHDGSIVKDRGDGYLIVFENASDGLRAAVQLQRDLAAADWDEPVGQLRVRLGMHSGTAEARDGDYFGPDVNRAARLEAAAHGGQVLLSEATRTLAQESLPDDVVLRDLGSHTLRGLTRQERLFQVVAPGLGDGFPPVRTVGGGRAPFPTFATSFVGRSTEVDELSERLQDPTTRVLTLLGPGGIGKTRLAVETAERVSDEYPGGSAFADLVPVTEPDGIAPAVARAFGVHPEGTAPVMEIVAAEISDRTLMVLDNFEHLAGSGAIIADLVARCPAITVLATSRTPLRISGEVIHHVEPLGTEASNGGLPAAVDLFLDRAAGHGAVIDMGGPDARAVRSIVERLDGLPLAIELVAAKVRLLNPGELDRRLGRSLSLGSGAADLPQRQHTIESTIDWSVEGLHPDERTLFERLSVFPAGATLEQIEDMAGDLDADPLELVSALVDNSLVVVAGDAGGNTRFRQLTLLRDYAARRLEASGQDRVIMARLLDHYASTAEELSVAMEHDGAQVMAIEYDYPNLAGALAWGLDAGRADDVVGILYRLWPVWFNGDRVADSAAWVEQAAVATSSPRLDWLHGLFAVQTGDYVGSADAFATALEGFTVAGDDTGVALTKAFAGGFADPGEGEAMLEEAAAYFSAHDRPMSKYVSRMFLSMRIAESGELERALEMRRDLQRDADAIGHAEITAWNHWNLAVTLVSLGRLEEAVAENREAFAAMSDLRYHEGIASAAEIEAIAAVAAGEPERGVLIHGGCGAVWDRLGIKVWWEIVPFIADAMTSAREQLGDERYEQVLTEGAALSIDELIDLAAAPDR
jgi:predicted ATPase/class 3 adenylate cyclase